MKLGLSPLLVLPVVLSGCATAVASAPAPASCRVQVAVEETDRPATHVDLGARSCEEKSVAVIARANHPPDSYFVAVTVSGTPEQPIVSSDVVQIAQIDGQPDPEIGARLLRNMPPIPFPNAPPLPPGPPPKSQRVIGGQWSEISNGTWSDDVWYRVLVRIDRS
jgi:hypothetical protein